jgi:hypothetical protein
MMPTWLAHLRARSLAAREAFLACAMAATLLVALPWACWRYGSAGSLALGLAAGVCWLGSALALWIADLHHAPNQVVQGMLFALALRTGLPLGFAVAAQASVGLLAWAGLIYFLLLFYLVALGVEVVLSLPEPVQTAGDVPHSGVN